MCFENVFTGHWFANRIFQKYGSSMKSGIQCHVLSCQGYLFMISGIGWDVFGDSFGMVWGGLG